MTSFLKDGGNVGFFSGTTGNLSVKLTGPESAAGPSELRRSGTWVASPLAAPLPQVSPGRHQGVYHLGEAQQVMQPQRAQLERGGIPQEPPPWLAMGPDLERSLWFLQRQHSETLHQLHAEIELLKRKNRDLHYQLIMHPELQKTDATSTDVPRKMLPRRVSEAKQAGTVKGTAPPAQPVPAPEPAAAPGQKQLLEEEVAVAAEKVAEFVDFWRQEELHVLGEATKAEVISPGEVVSAVPKGVKIPTPEPEAVPAQTASPRPKEFRDQATSPVRFVSPSCSTTEEIHLPSASSNPFLVNVLPSHMRKPPTLEECEVVIRQLWNINHIQMQELMYLRSCLEDIQKTKRIPEDYRLVGQIGQDSRRLSNVKNSPRRCRMLNPLPPAERAVLPALKQTLGNAFAERQKRTQAVQRSRLQRTAR